MKLTERAVAALALEPGRKDRLVADDATPGLFVRVTPGGRSFLAQYVQAGVKRRVPIGRHGAVTLDAARIAARNILGSVANGTDVAAERAKARAAAEAERQADKLTLAALLDQWAALALAQKRESYRREAVRALKVAFAHCLNKRAESLSRAEVVRTLDAIAASGRTAIAGRTKAYGSACFAWAQKRGAVEGNPFHGLPIATGIVQRERCLTDAELGAVWRAIGAMHQPFGPLLRLLVLTLVRRDEVAQMRWSEISPDLTTWTIPGSRMKRGAAHVVALPEPAREALQAVPKMRGQDLVFSTTGRTPVSGFSKVKAALDAASGVTDWRLHDLRRTGVTALARLGFDVIVADKLLAHQPSNLHGAGKVYQQYGFEAERKAALEAWAAHVLRCAEGGERAPNVVALRPEVA